jgi:hypothetical protein
MSPAPRPRDVAIVALVVGGLAVYILLGAAGFWEPLPPKTHFRQGDRP